jgi:hypothetical protein
MKPRQSQITNTLEWTSAITISVALSPNQIHAIFLKNLRAFASLPLHAGQAGSRENALA